MRLLARREAFPCVCAASDERLRMAREFAAEMALWPTPVEVMRAAWGQVPDVLPEEPPAPHLELQVLGVGEGRQLEAGPHAASSGGSQRRRRFRPFGQLYARQDNPGVGWRLSTWPGIDE